MGKNLFDFGDQVFENEDNNFTAKNNFETKKEKDINSNQNSTSQEDIKDQAKKMYDKICDDLKREVESLSFVTNKQTDCIIYAYDFFRLKNQLLKQEIDFLEYPFINAFGVKFSNSQIVKFAKQSVVSFITKQTKVSAQIDVSKNILGIENFYNKNILSQTKIFYANYHIYIISNKL